MTTGISRRQLFAASLSAGLGSSIIPKIVLAQAENVPRIPAEKAGMEHRSSLSNISKLLGNSTLDTAEGLFKLVGFLVAAKVMTKEQGEKLKEIIKLIFSDETLDSILKKINDIYKELVKDEAQVAIAIASIAIDTIAYVKDLGAKIDRKKAMAIVRADVTGALSGAVTAKGFNSNVYWIIACAVIGGTASSADAYFASAQNR